MVVYETVEDSQLAYATEVAKPTKEVLHKKESETSAVNRSSSLHYCHTIENNTNQSHSASEANAAVSAKKFFC